MSGSAGQRSLASETRAWGAGAEVRFAAGQRGRSGGRRAWDKGTGQGHGQGLGGGGKGAPVGPRGALWKGIVGQAREGTSDKTGVGRTKDDGGVMVQRRFPGTPRGAGHVGLTHTEIQRGRLWTA